MKTLVVYYSLEGNTAFAAKKIAENLGADLLELVPVKAYPKNGPAKFLVGGMKASMHEAPPLIPHQANVKNYDCIVLGTPVWASNMAPPLRTFIRGNDFSGKRLALFACSMGGNSEKCLTSMKNELRTDSVAAEMGLIDPLRKQSPENSDKIAQFCRDLTD
jgi:flavodoxin